MNIKQKNIIDLTFAQNDFDKFFLNLSKNPEGIKNVDFKSQLYKIYETVKNEFSKTFQTNTFACRKTDFLLVKQNNELKVFITPAIHFANYLKSKGSLYRIQSKVLDLPDAEGKIEQKDGYLLPVNELWDYFSRFSDMVDHDFVSETFLFFNQFTQVILKIIEKMYFIPVISIKKNLFKIDYDIFSNRGEVKNILDSLEKIFPENVCINLENNTIIRDFDKKELIAKYLNYILYRFFNAKSAKFENNTATEYFIQNKSFDNFKRGKEIAGNLAVWLDEMRLGSYDIVPLLRLENFDENTFTIEMDITSKKDEKIYPLSKIFTDDKIFGETCQNARDMIQKQTAFIAKYLPYVIEIFDSKGAIKPTISLNEILKIMTYATYPLQNADINILLPQSLSEIVIPCAGISAKVKTGKKEELLNRFIQNAYLNVNLDDIISFSYEISLGDEKISKEEFEKMVQNSEGLIRFKDKYIMIDAKEARRLLHNLNKTALPKKITKIEFLQTALTGTFEGIAFNYDEACEKILEEFKKPEDTALPDKLEATLKPYQQKGFKWLYTNTKKGFGSCLADDMGLGKTIQVLSLILKLKKERKLTTPGLIICPTTLLSNWEDEIDMFAPTIKMLTYHGTDRKIDIQNDIILTTHGIVRSDIEKLKDINWSLVVIDEAQNIKNDGSAQAAAVKSLKTSARIAMTGTPIENRLTELWSIFDFINPGYLGSLGEFQKNYSIPIEKLKDKEKAQRLKLISSPFILRRKKNDKNIICDLPEKSVINHFCHLKKEQAALYGKTLKDTMELIDNTMGKHRKGNIFKLITSLKQICNHPYHYLRRGDMSKDASGKTQKLVSIINRLIKNDEKALIFTQYRQMGEILLKIIQNETGHKSLFLHGAVPRYQRDDMISTFQHDYENKLMIISLKAGGAGLNLTEATNVIHFDLWWNPAVEDQASDRIYRIGQEENVTVHRLITRGTFEEKINYILNSKRNLVDETLFEGEKNMSELTYDEIQKIFCSSFEENEQSLNPVFSSCP